MTLPDFLPTYCQARVLVLGVGNVLFGNDGFGPTVAEQLAAEYDLPEDVVVMDAGTGVRKLLFTLTLSAQHPEEIVVVDAVDWGMQVGEVVEIAASDLPATKIDDFSLHQVPTSNLLRELEEQCGVSVRVVVCDIGAIEQVIQPGLSPDIEEAARQACTSLAERYRLPVADSLPE